MINSPQIVLIENIPDAEKELELLGVNPLGIDLMKNKSVFHAVKIYDLTPPQANIIKQALLSAGSDAATSHGTINNSVKKTDALLFGTENQFSKLCEKLKSNYFKLPGIADQITKAIRNFNSCPPPLKLKGHTLDFSKRTFIMGIVNVTPDSFSENGKYFKPEDAINHARELIQAGADIIDIGGESTRPGAKTINEKEELKRVLPIVKALAKGKKAVISVDTRKSKVADACLKAGAHIINDISGLNHDKKMAPVIAKHKAGVIIMHMQGTPQNMQKNPVYKDLMGEIKKYYFNSIEIADKAGILLDRIILDPGFGFGKTLDHNYEILKRLKELKAFGRPILAGTSRKSMIGKVLNVLEDQRLIGTAATNAVAIFNGANIIRVHDVFEMKQAAMIADKIVGRKSW